MLPGLTGPLVCGLAARRCRARAPSLPRGVGLLAAALLWTACQLLPGCGSGEGPSYSGTLGASPAQLEGDTFVIDVMLGELGPAQLYVDTGSPITLIESTLFPSRAVGTGTLSLSAFGVEFSALPVVFSDFADLSNGPAQVPVAGLLGGDSLRYFAATFDYAMPQVSLAEQAPDDAEFATRTAPAIDVPFELLGGGQFQLSNGSTTPVSATRIVVPVTIEGQEVSAVLDTGASFVVVDPAFFNGLGGDGRPALAGVQFGTVMGMDAATLSRLKSVKVGDAELTSVPIAVVSSVDFVESLREETMRPVQILLGATFLREYLLTIDYPQQNLLLRRYKDRSHIDDNEFVRVGFFIQVVPYVFSPHGYRIVVQNVVPGSDAELKGVAVNDVLATVQGQDVDSLDPPTVDLMLHGTAGDTVEVGFSSQGVGSVKTVEIQVQDLLPAYQ